MMKRVRQRLLLKMILLSLMVFQVLEIHSVCAAVNPGQNTPSETLYMEAGIPSEERFYAVVNEGSFRRDESPEQGSENPGYPWPFGDDRDELTTAAGLADLYGLVIDDIRVILPDWVPTTDETLFEAYLQLYRQTKPILYDLNGQKRTSGYALGMFIAAHKISIQWEKKSLVDCGSSGKACVDRNNPDPQIASTIFIVDIGYKPTNVADIYAGRIAHEAFHLTFPYGNVNSKLEEMDANRIGSILVGSNAADAFYAPDYSAQALNTWAEEYCANVFGRCSYENLPTYPDSRWARQFSPLGKP
mgnify:FL=1